MIDSNSEVWPECKNCGGEYNPIRKKLGYDICLVCGDEIATIETAHKSKCTAPLFNKGSYQYVGSKEAARWAGK